MIIKMSDVETHITPKSVDIGDIGCRFYTEDENTAFIRIRINYHGEPVDLTKTDMKPRLDLFMQDDSKFIDEKLEVLIPESGLVQYSIPPNVIKHAGRTKCKLFMMDNKKSIHVANFFFNIVDSGVEEAVSKEITLNLVKDTVREIISEDLTRVLDDDFKDKLINDVEIYLSNNNELFRGFKGEDGTSVKVESTETDKNGNIIVHFTDDTSATIPKGKDGKSFTYDDFTPEQLESLKGPKGDPLKYSDLTQSERDELIKNVTNQSLSDFEIEDNSIFNEKLVDGTIQPEKTSFFELKTSNNLLISSKIQLGKTLSTDGQIIDDSRYALTNLIPLDSELGEQLNFTRGTYRIGLYDKDKKFLGRPGVTDGTSYKPAPITKTKYVRLSSTIDLNTVMVNKGETLLPYEEPFGNSAKLKKDLLPKQEIQNDSITTNKLKDNSVTTTKIKDNAITPDKVDFIDHSVSNNLLDINNVIINKSIDTDGNVIDDEVRWLSDFIPVDSDLEEQINFTRGTYRIALYDGGKNFLGRPGVTDKTSYKPSSITKTKYVRLSGTMTNGYTKVMVNKGASLLPYEEYVDPNIYKLNKSFVPSISDDMLEIIENNVSKNIFNVDKVIVNKSIDIDGTIINDDLRWLSDYIPLDSSLGEQLNFTKGTYRIALYDKDKKFLGRPGVTEDTSYIPASITNTKYVRLSSPLTNDYTKVMANKGNALLPYEEYYSPNKKIKNNYLSSITPEKTTFFDIKNTVNLLDTNKVIVNKSIDLEGNVIDDNLRWLSDFIPVDSDLEEQINISQGTYRIALYDEDKKFIARAGVTDGTSYAPIKGSGTKYVRISGTLTNDYTKIMVNKGGNLLPYEKYTGNKVKLKNEYLPDSDVNNISEKVNPEMTTFFNNGSKNSNLLNMETLSMYKTVELDGTITNNDLYWLTDFIPVDSDLEEQINISQGTYRIALYDEDKKFIARAGVTDGTSYVPKKGSGTKYVRISGTQDYTGLKKASDIMINKGNNLLPYENPYNNNLKIQNKYIDFDNFLKGKNNVMQSKTNVFTPSIPKLNFELVKEGYDEPLWLSQDGKRIYGHIGNKLWVSYDDCDTFTTIIDDIGSNIKGIRETYDNELIISTERDMTNHNFNTRLYKTSGYNKDTATLNSYSKVLESSSSDATIRNNWGMSVYENIIVISEYGLKGENGARHAWLSEDHGNTFKEIFDQKTYWETVKGAPYWDDFSAHFHSVAYDPYWDRIWIVLGDTRNSATVYSDDHGDTWELVNNDIVLQYTSIMPLPNCVLFGSDRAKQNGVFVYWRTDKKDEPVIDPLLVFNDNPVTYVSQLFFKRDYNATTPSYIPFTVETGLGDRVIIGTVDGKKAYILHQNKQNETFGGNAWNVLGNTAKGNIVTCFQDENVENNKLRIARAKAPEWIQM